MKLIDADALDESFKETVEKAVEWRKGVDGNAEIALCADRAIVDFTEAKLRVESMPAIDPVRHGKWIRDEFGTRCGACGLYAYRDKFDDQPWESPYCPNCGAKMDGEQEKQDYE